MFALMLAGSAQIWAETPGAHRVLVFSKTAGWVHTSIPAGIRAIEELGAANAFTVDSTKDATVFRDDELRRYDAVIFLSTSGSVLNAPQKAAFERYIQAGGGFVGIHSASTTEKEWAWFGQLLGARFDNHPINPSVRPAMIRVTDRNHESTEHLPEEWSREDEWYNFRALQPGLRVLAQLDETSYLGGTHGRNHPIAWCREFDGGRTFYTAGGHTEESFSEPLFREHLLGGIRYAIGAGKRDYGEARAVMQPDETRFKKTILIDKLRQPMELVAADDGRVFFTELATGRLMVHEPATGETSLVHTFDIYNRGGTGLIGVTLDPNFDRNGWIYVYYTPSRNDDGTDQINFDLSRWTLTPSGVDPDSEKVILQVRVSRSGGAHYGGSLAWDKDGNLFIATGDNTPPHPASGFAPLDERPDHVGNDAQRSASNTNDLGGKILRIRPEPDGSYSIPPGNLFPVGTENARSEIYAMGCRNPARIAVNPRTSALYWADIGPDAGEDRVRGPRGYDEFNQAKRAGNFGWPYFVGNNRAYVPWDTATNQATGPAFDPAAPVNRSPNNTGLERLPPAQSSMIWYPYAASAEFPVLGVGARCAMMGDFYTCDAAAVGPAGLPEFYDGRLFVFDWMRNWMATLSFDGDENLVEITPFMAGRGDFRRPIDLTFSRDGVLYVLEYGSVYGADNDDARLAKIEYQRDARPPVAVAGIVDRAAVAAAEERNARVFLTSEQRWPPLLREMAGAAPLTVGFSSKGSRDLDSEDTPERIWDFGDGSKSTDAGPVHVFAKPGLYRVTLHVRTAAGLSADEELTVEVGNEPPRVTFTAPENQTFYWPDQPLEYAAAVADPEDGENLVPAEVTLELRKTGGSRPVDRGSPAPDSALMTLDCRACHMPAGKAVGPSYEDIAQRYRGTTETVKLLAEKVIAGGAGSWGEIPMSAHPQLSMGEAEDLVRAIFALSDAPEIRAIPSQGTLTLSAPKPDDPRARYVLRANYTDQGAVNARPLTASSTMALRPPRIPAAFADAHVGYERFRDSLSGGNNPSHLLFRDIDLTGVTSLVCEYTAGQKGDEMEFRLDSYAGPLVATSPIHPTKDWDTTATVTFTWQDAIAGKHDIYLIVLNRERPDDSVAVMRSVTFSRSVSSLPE